MMYIIVHKFRVNAYLNFKFSHDGQIKALFHNTEMLVNTVK